MTRSSRTGHSYAPGYIEMSTLPVGPLGCITRIKARTDIYMPDDITRSTWAPRTTMEPAAGSWYITSPWGMVSLDS